MWHNMKLKLLKRHFSFYQWNTEKKKKNIHHENNNFIDKATAHDYF